MTGLVVLVGVIALGVGFAVGFAMCDRRWEEESRERIDRARIARTEAELDGFERGYRAGMNAFDPKTGKPREVWGTIMPDKRFPYSGGSVLPENQE